MAARATVLACAAGASYVYEQPKPGYIAGWVEGNSPTGAGTNYKTLAEAMVKCDGFVGSAASASDCKLSDANKGTAGSGCVCHGVTLNGGNYQLRAAASITPDTVNNEQSWLRTDSRCESSWGGHFLLVLLCVSILYVGGGRLYHLRHGRTEWPHAQHWAELRSLVLDGANFARARVQGGNLVVTREKGPRSSSLKQRLVPGRGQAAELRTTDAPTHDRSSRRKDGHTRKHRRKKETDLDHDSSSKDMLSLSAEDLSHPSEAHISRTVASAGGGKWVHVPA